MSTRDFFKKGSLKSISGKSNASAFELDGAVESSEHITERQKQKERFVPAVDFASASNFARYGSAEEYYRNSFKRIHQQFPYDGTAAEKVQFDNESTLFDKYVFDKIYPRSTGYAIFSQTDVGWGSQGSITAGWGVPSAKEYISFKGGPHTSSAGMEGESLAKAFDESVYRASPNANVYDTDIYDTEGVNDLGRRGTREGNLRFDLSKGVTTEFWVRKGIWVTGSTQKEVIFDLWNGGDTGSTDGSYDPKSGYGRLLIYLTGSGPATEGANPFRVHLASGSSVWDMKFGATGSISTGSLTRTWNHVALSFLSSSTDKDLQARFYINGVLQETTASSHVTNFGQVTGSMIGYVGALQTTPSGNAFDGLSMVGGAKLSGSIDEFRFWKAKRNSKDIGRNWFTQVPAGTNDSIANTELGVYLKFNEGIVGSPATDSIVLDYSGRLSNGNWTGYAAGARNTGSAMVSSSAAASEYRDPILYSYHPDVEAELSQYVASGSAWDEQNNSMLYHSYPSFMLEEEEEATTPHLKYLTQIMSSYFDDLQLQIESLTQISSRNYPSASFAPPSFAQSMLGSKGFISPAIFPDASILEQIANRDEDRDFALELSDIKSQIYQNIYNNLVLIYKTKGTEESFRNLIRCFGVDDDLVSINLYPKDSTLLLEENSRLKTTKKKYVNFNIAACSSGTIYQQTSSEAGGVTSVNPDTVGVTYISGTYASSSNTAEIEVVFPKRIDASRGNRAYTPTPFHTSSIFGCHTALDDAEDFDWPASSADYNFELYAVRPDLKSDDAYFLLKDRKGNFSLTSSLYGDVYDNQKWNFAVRIKHDKYPLGNVITGSDSSTLGSRRIGDSRTLNVELRGINTFTDVVVNDFTLTTSVVATEYLTNNRRYYMGAHLTNFTGAVTHLSDVRAASLRHWSSYVDDIALYSHARDPENYGALNPMRSTYLTEDGLTGSSIPQIETLALNWDFSTLTSSNAAGGFVVDDFSSGSAKLRERYPGKLGPIVGNYYAARGTNFPVSTGSVVSTEYIPTARQRLPEHVGGVDMIKAISTAETIYPRDHRPDDYYYTFEKNMYKTISEEMLNMFGTIIEFNNLIGAPIHKYRSEYKGLDKLRSLFFERVKNTPDVDKYMSYYKWIDSSLSEMLAQLMPASTNMSSDILNMIENTILERNKYRHKFPLVKEVESTEGSISGYAENTYPWRTGHAPVGATENENCFWWKERAERSGPTITSGESTVDAQREDIRKIQAYSISSSAPQHVTLAGTVYETSRYRARALPRIYNFSTRIGNAIRSRNFSFVNHKKNYYKGAITFGSTTGLDITSVNSGSGRDCTDITDTPAELNKEKKHFTTSGQHDEKHAPFTMYSSSVGTGYEALLASDFMKGVGITNNHEDDIHDTNEIPMQGTFTERFVGGSPHRHADINHQSATKSGKNELDSALDRIEAYDLDLSTDSITVRHQDVHQPRSSFYRDETAKRMVNLKNIKQVTGSSPAVTEIVSGTLQASIGNFSKRYEVVGFSDRKTNNPSFIKSEGFGSASVASPIISSLNDYTKPTRTKSEHIIVERFSAPGGPETAGDSAGGPFLDLESAQYSPYNDINIRNWTVRKPLRDLLTERSERFGIRSGSSAVAADYSTAASFHKVNRNPLKREEYVDHTSSNGYAVTASYDNWFVQHHIPRSDTQYAWITASYISSYVYGHAPKDGYYSGSSEGVVPAILFASASAWSIGGAKIDYAGINTLIYEPVSSSDARVGYPLTIPITTYRNQSVLSWGKTDDILNALLLHRRSIYGFSSWLPIENNSYSPIVRAWKKENTLAFNAKPGKTIISEGDSYEVKQNRFGSLQRFTEPPVTSRNFPLKLILDIDTAQGEKRAKVESVFGNEVDDFTNASLNQALNMYPRDGVAYNKVKSLYLDGALGSDTSPVSGFKSLSYKQGVYPKAQNSFLAKTRSRPGFTNNFWRGSRADRNTLGDKKFGSYLHLSGTYSSWNMDADTDFFTAITGATAGILQNNHTHVHDNKKIAAPGVALTASILFHLKHTVAASASVKSRTGAPVVQTGSSHTTSTTMPLGKAPIGGGNALWQVGNQAVYGDIAGAYTSDSTYPWKDNYDDYVLELRAHNKDYSVIPEFRISEHIEKYVNNRDGDFFSPNSSFLSIEGAASSFPQNSSEDDFYKTYSNSDFMKQFDIIREDHKGFVDPFKIKLTCKAIKKFVPYNGFYPSELLADLYTRFSSSYMDNVSYTGTDGTGGSACINGRSRAFITPMFAPGIWCNMVKSGMAVDFPVYTGSYVVHRPFYGGGGGNLSEYHLMSTSSGGGTSGFDKRIPFEAIIKPEDYLANTTLVDMFPHPSASMNVTASWDGSGDGLYKMKAHNALASMIEFFLPGKNNKGELATLVSAPENEWKRFESEKIYGMRIRLRKSYNKNRQAHQIGGMDLQANAYYTGSYTTPHDTDADIREGLEETITICSRPSSFGPPVCGRHGTHGATTIAAGSTAGRGAIWSGSLDSLTGVNPGFTPPYYDGEAWADFLYRHTGSSQPTLDNIQASGTLIQWRFDHLALSSSNGGSNFHPYGYNNINNYSMQLTAAVNIFGKKKLPAVSSDSSGNKIYSTGDITQKTNVWAIQPKMEVPILNVHAASASISSPTCGSESIPRSIWSQFGTIPTGPTGIFLDVGDIDAHWLTNRKPLLEDAVGDDSLGIAGSQTPQLYRRYYTTNEILPLTDQVGFKKRTEKLGKLAKNRVVKEAIVAVPFLEKNEKREFFEIPKKDISAALSILEKGAETNSVVDMVSKMKEYVFPPNFDFVKNPDKITPFAMYIFEFKHKFNQDDLSYIWQGLQPRSAASMQLSEASIEHRLLSKELMGKALSITGEPIPSELRWMVFKVKQKAPTNYYEKVIRHQTFESESPTAISVGRTTSTETEIPEYSYNWPYDYFSLIEFAKINSEVKFAAAKAGQQPVDEDDSSVITSLDPCPEAELVAGIQSIVKKVVEEQK